MQNVNPVPGGGSGGQNSSSSKEIQANSDKFKEAMKVQKVEETDAEQRNKRKRQGQVEEEDEDPENAQPQPAAPGFTLEEDKRSTFLTDLAEGNKGISATSAPNSTPPLTSSSYQSSVAPPKEEPPLSEPAAISPDVDTPNSLTSTPSVALSINTPQNPEATDTSDEEGSDENNSLTTTSPSNNTASSQSSSSFKKPQNSLDENFAFLKGDSEDSSIISPLSMEALEKVSHLSKKEEKTLKDEHVIEYTEEEKSIHPDASSIPQENKALPLKEKLVTATSAFHEDAKGKKKEEIKTKETTASIDTPISISATIAQPFAETLPPSPSLPSYAHFSKSIEQLFEKMVGLIVYSKSQAGSDDVKTVVITLNSEEYQNSPFYGTKVTIKEYSTAPNAFNIEFEGDDKQVAVLEKNAPSLMAAFAAGSYNFRVNRIETSLRSSNSDMLFKRKESISDKGKDPNNRQ